MVTLWPMICGEVDGSVFRERGEVKIEQARNGFVAGEAGEQQLVLAQRRGQRDQTAGLCVEWHELILHFQCSGCVRRTLYRTASGSAVNPAAEGLVIAGHGLPSVAGMRIYETASATMC